MTFLFEKPKSFKMPIGIGNIMTILIFVLLASFLTYGACSVYGILGEKNKLPFLDWINAAAQIATCLTFYYLIKQNFLGAKLQRQTVLFLEAKSQIEKMITVLAGIDTGERTNLENINRCVTQLANLAVGFKSVFDEMDEDVHRAIVRMHWQDMFFNNLSHALISLDIEPVIGCAVGADYVKAAKVYAAGVMEQENCLPVFKRYEEMRLLLEYGKIKSEFSLKGKVTSLNEFVYGYLNSYTVNDLMHGMVNIIDIKAKAPILAVAGPDDWALQPPQK